MTAPTLPDLVAASRLLPRAYVSQPTEPAQPVLTPALVAALRPVTVPALAVPGLRLDWDLLDLALLPVARVWAARWRQPGRHRWQAGHRQEVTR